MNKEQPYELNLLPELAAVLGHFEINCVSGCCGLNAYMFDSVHASHAIAVRGKEAVEHSVMELEWTFQELELLPDDQKVYCVDVNAQWPKGEAIAFFEKVKKHIQKGLVVGPITPVYPHHYS